jgi:hypothetical protein
MMVTAEGTSSRVCSYLEALVTRVSSKDSKLRSVRSLAALAKGAKEVATTSGNALAVNLPNGETSTLNLCE